MTSCICFGENSPLFYGRYKFLWVSSIIFVCIKLLNVDAMINLYMNLLSE